MSKLSTKIGKLEYAGRDCHVYLVETDNGGLFVEVTNGPDGGGNYMLSHIDDKIIYFNDLLAKKAHRSDGNFSMFSYWKELGQIYASALADYIKAS